MTESWEQNIITTLSEGAGITAMIGSVLVVVIKMIKKNGCTFKCYNCSGQPVAEIDCEEGAPTQRHRAPPQETETSSDTPV